MSTHPNAILLLTLTPDDLARKTWRAILNENHVADEEDQIKISATEYHHMVLEGDYHDGHQLSGKPGDILVWDLVTYGYGDQIEWEKLAQQQARLDSWARLTAQRHHCAYKISVTANYW